MDFPDWDCFDHAIAREFFQDILDFDLYIRDVPELYHHSRLSGQDVDQEGLKPIEARLWRREKRKGSMSLAVDHMNPTNSSGKDSSFVQTNPNAVENKSTSSHENWTGEKTHNATNLSHAALNNWPPHPAVLPGRGGASVGSE